MKIPYLRKPNKKDMRFLKLLSFCLILILVSMAAFCQKNKGKGATKANLKTSMDSVSYTIGISIGNSLGAQGMTDLNFEAFEAGVRAMLSKDTTAMTPMAANEYLNKYFMAMQNKKNEEQMKKGQDWLAANKSKEGVVTTASGLQYKVVKQGTGRKPGPTDTVKVHYHGTLTSGKVFDSSVQRGEPIEFPVNGVIAGWTEALQLMNEGSKYILYIPSELAYGPRGAGQDIGPNEVLVFEVELLQVL
jgi:FKBP-type peptidyl-prolyl cis-trans isomerase FklB